MILLYQVDQEESHAESHLEKLGRRRRRVAAEEAVVGTGITGRLREVEIAVEADKIVLLPVCPKHTLDELIREQKALEREFGQALVEREWLDNVPTSRENL